MDHINAFKKSNPITARPITVAYHLFNTLKHETQQESSELLTVLIRHYAEHLQASGYLGPESTELLNIWGKLEALGDQLANVQPKG